MKLGLILLFICGTSSISVAQNNFFKHSDTVNNPRVIGASIGIGTVWAGSMTALWQLWYANSETGKIHSFDDSKNWLQMDKAGHFYTAYQINRLTTDVYDWSGISEKNAVWIGTGISLGYQTTLEVFDGFSNEWGFSWSDMTANTIGTFSYTAQQLIWKEQRIIPKFSYHPTKFNSIRPNILGETELQSIFKDYNGQTYWLTFSIGSFFPKSKIPKWACLSLGYSVNNKLVGDQTNYLDVATGNYYQEERQFLLSLDIDFSKLPIKKPWLKSIVNQFNYLKIPFPAILFKNGKVFGEAIYF